jgi:hypothetical protein
MKKIIVVSVIVLAIVLCLCSVAANASDMDYTQYTSMSYEVQGNFMVYIPSEISAGNPIVVSAGEMNIPENKAVAIRIGGLDMSNAIHLTNGITSDVVDVFFKRSNGTRYAYDDNLIGMFEAGSEGSSYEVETEVDYAAGVIKAGTYTGIVEFLISYIDK